MTRALRTDALRRIQDIVQEAKGSPLDREAIRRVEAVLRTLGEDAEARPMPDTGYSAREASILFADLRGFSAIASAYPADTVLGVLNRCFARMVDIVARHFGMIDKFMGDAIMAVFHGDPAASRDHARRAVLCAVEMQNEMHELRRRHKAEGIPELYMGIGISSGRVMTGLIGSDTYRAFTAIGDEVNMAARIEALSLRGQVLMSEATYSHCSDFVRAGEPMDVYVKGRAESLRVREALGVPALGKVVPRQDARKSPRVRTELELDYWRVEAKVIRASAGRGAVRDVGYHGLLAELTEAAPLYCELKLAFDLPGLGRRAEDVYARVVSVREQGGRFLCGMEFTSLPAATSAAIQQFVQMRLQDLQPPVHAPDEPPASC